jgi:SAM-dependent methyltransferase
MIASPTFDPRLERCPLCRSARLIAHDRDARGITLDRCRDCGVVFCNPQYTADHLARYYAAYVTPAELDGRVPERWRLRKLAAFDWIERFRHGGRFLAFGCGGGLELEIARARGFDVEGYDVDPAATARVAGRLGLPVHCGAFDQLELPQASFGCVFADQVLEHLRDPAGSLRRFRELLQPDGVLYLGVPNLASWSARQKTLLGRLGLKGGRRGSHYDTDHHLFHFSPVVLRRLLTREFGFEVLAVAGDPWLDIHPLRRRLACRHPAFCSRLAVVARPA